MSDESRVMPLRYQKLINVKDFNSYETDAYERVDSLDAANVITSESRHGGHKPVLDIDVPATLIPSSTPGHSHLYIDVHMSWEQYARLLDVLAEVGIIQEGYVACSKKRGFTGVRLPWIRKRAPEPINDDCGMAPDADWSVANG